MSYDISLIDKKTKRTINTNGKHNLMGGTYTDGGTRDAWLNITYNYSKYFYQVFGENGIRRIYGMTGRQSSTILKKAINKLRDDVSSDYWKATEGNAKKALEDLLALADLAPDGIWDGD